MLTHETFRGVLVLVLLGVALGIGYNFASTKKVPWKRAERKLVKLEDPSPPPAESPVPEASPPETPAPGDSARETPAPQAETSEAPAGGEAEGTDGMRAAHDPSTVDTGKAHLYDDIDESEFPREISLAKAKAFYDRGGLVVLDAREQSEYAMGHIKGALSAPHDEKVGDVAWLDAMAKKPNPILVYCDGGDCELSLNLGFAIAESGHRKVLVLTDGYPAWEDAGYPTVTGDLP